MFLHSYSQIVIIQIIATFEGFYCIFESLFKRHYDTYCDAGYTYISCEKNNEPSKTCKFKVMFFEKSKKKSSHRIVRDNVFLLFTYEILASIFVMTKLLIYDQPCAYAGINSFLIDHIPV